MTAARPLPEPSFASIATTRSIVRQNQPPCQVHPIQPITNPGYTATFKGYTVQQVCGVVPMLLPHYPYVCTIGTNALKAGTIYISTYCHV